MNYISNAFNYASNGLNSFLNSSFVISTQNLFFKGAKKSYEASEKIALKLFDRFVDRFIQYMEKEMDQLAKKSTEYICNFFIKKLEEYLNSEDASEDQHENLSTLKLEAEKHTVAIHNREEIIKKLFELHQRKMENFKLSSDDEERDSDSDSYDSDDDFSDFEPVDLEVGLLGGEVNKTA